VIIVVKKIIPRSNNSAPEIAKLQSKLNKAHEFIKKLQRHNSQLQDRVTHLENQQSRSQNPKRRMPINSRERLLFRRAVARKKRRVRLAAMSSLVLLGIGGAAIAVNRLFFSPPVTPPVASSSVTVPVPVKVSSSASIPPSPTVTATRLTRATLVYSPSQPPDLKQSAKLQSIVDSAVNLAKKKGLPTNKLAITLIDAKNKEIAGYRPNEPRYPASIVKMFWLVEFYAQKEAGILSEDPATTKQINNMIKYSDNDDSAFILDKISDAKSQPTLSRDKFKAWLQKRLYVNNFFAKAGYKNININQKAYPVYAQNLSSPRGSELQIRQVPNLPQKNLITTNHVARLIYEICFTKEAVSPAASAKMCNLLTRDLKPEVWKKQTQGFHPIYGLLGQAFPNSDITFASKAGGTSTTRSDAAFISTKDGRVAYTLAVFGNDRAYAGNGSILPQISRLVFDKMKARESQ
jgi:beta-lactamase class A